MVIDRGIKSTTNTVHIFIQVGCQVLETSLTLDVYTDDSEEGSDEYTCTGGISHGTGLARHTHILHAPEGG